MYGQYRGSSPLHTPSHPQSPKEPLLVGLPKGRFLAHTQWLLAQCEATPLAPAALRYASQDGTVEYLLTNARDIPSLVASNRLHLGLAPDEWILEAQSRGRAPLPFDVVGRVNWVATNLEWLAVRSSDATQWPPSKGISVATSFPNLARALLRDEHVEAATILEVAGSVEALVPRIAAIGFDCVETGATADAHNLARIHVAHSGLGQSLIASPAAERGRNPSVMKVADTIFKLAQQIVES